LAVLLVAAGGCTVRPLYGDAGIGETGGTAAMLASVEVAAVETRQALEARNHLIFLLGRGAGQPTEPAYVLDLGITSETSRAATVQITRDNEPSAGTVTLTSDYVLTDAASEEVLATGRRVASASFDRTRQEFANLRAERDAENRAARELAEMLRLALVHDLGRTGAR
jgi:LPS-assembly lipoprotein